MLILNAGVPRSGTVLVNAIVRTLLAQRGIGVAQANPHGAELPALVRRLQRGGDHRHKAVLVHTHSWSAEAEALLAGDADVLAFANYRDPRDVCVSLMRLHEHSFDDTMTVVESYFAAFEATVAALDAMVIPYELLVAGREAHIFQIARALGFWPTLDQVRAVDEETSVDRHRRIMDEVNAGTVEDLAVRDNRNRTLREDRRTLINDRHIQSGVAGRWRGELDEAQQKEINVRFAPLLKRYGYGA